MSQRKLLHDYKCMLVKYGMQRKIWVKRRMVGRNMVEEERIGQNMGEEEGSDLHFHPSQDQVVLHKHPKDHFSSSWLSSSFLLVFYNTFSLDSSSLSSSSCF